MSKTIATYTIQDWLFSEANGKFDIDLAESGIQFHYLNDLKNTHNVDLNYSTDCGNEKLREKIAGLYGVNQNQVVITHGAQESLYLFYRSYLKSSDHVITFTPGWQQSWEVPAATGASVTCIPLSAKNNYELDINEIEKAILPNTRLLILTNPANPTGVTVSDHLFDELISLCERHHIFIMCDEEYFTDYKNSLIHHYPHCAVTSGLSKVYGFPGLRTGWFISSQKIAEDVINYKRYVTVSNSTLCEHLALEVLKNHEHYLTHYQTLRDEGYRTFSHWINQLPELEPIPTHNTPFAYCKLNMPMTAMDFCRELLAQKRVLVMPGEVFCDFSTLRISFARYPNILLPGLEKIAELIESIKNKS